MKKLLLPLLLASAAVAHAAPAPTLIPFQGRLTDQAGVGYTDGQFTLIFNLYDQAVGGNVLWFETHQKVGVVNGMVNVFLGSINPALASMDFTQTRHLGITIDADNNPNTPDPEMVPRQMIIPAFWAKQAENSLNSVKLNNYDWTPLFGVNSPVGPLPGNKLQLGSVTTAQLAPGSVTASILAPGSVGSVQLQTNSVTSGSLAPGAVTFTRRARRVIGVSGSSVGDITVSSSINQTNSLTPAWQIMSGSSVSMETTGGAVFALLTPFEGAGNNQAATIAVTPGSTTVHGQCRVQIGIFKDGVLMGSHSIRIDIPIAAPDLNNDVFFSIPASLTVLMASEAGQHTFDIRVKSLDESVGFSINIANCRLAIYEP